VHQKELKEKYLEFNTPFTASSFPKKIPRKEITDFLNGLLKKGHIEKKKIGNMHVYWKKDLSITGSIDKEKKKGKKQVAKQKISKKPVSSKDRNYQELRNKITELEELLEEERVRNARLRKIDAIDEIDSEWEEVCYRMGEAIAHKTGLTLNAVLKQFGAPMDE